MGGWVKTQTFLYENSILSDFVLAFSQRPTSPTLIFEEFRVWL